MVGTKTVQPSTKPLKNQDVALGLTINFQRYIIRKLGAPCRTMPHNFLPYLRVENYYHELKHSTPNQKVDN